MSAYDDFVKETKGNRGVIAAWPWNSDGNGFVVAGIFNSVAARYDSAQYAALYNAGKIPANLDQRASGSNKFVYVRAPQAVTDDYLARQKNATDKLALTKVPDWYPSWLPNWDDMQKYLRVGAVLCGVVLLLVLLLWLMKAAKLAKAVA